MTKALQNAELKRSSIVREAGRLFLRHGYGATSMDAVAREANVTKQTVYRYFGTKEELFVAVMEQVRSSQAAPTALGDGPLAEELLRFGTEVLAFHLSDEALGLYRLMLTEGSSGGLMPSFMKAGPRRLLQPLAAFLRERCPALDDPAFAAQMFLTMVLAPRAQRLMHGAMKLDKATQVEHVGRVVNFFVGSVNPSGR